MALEFVEDYIEFLHGTLDKDGNRRTVSYHQPVIKLATYDKSPIASMGTYCQRAAVDKLQECLTDRQIVLARKIVGKYRRQFAEHGITLPQDIDNLPSKYRLRVIDRTKAITADIENKKFALRFPYDPQKINNLNTYAHNSAGECSWDNTAKCWTMDLTEGNLKTVLDLFQNEDLKIDNSIAPYVEDVLKVRPTQLPRAVLANGQIVLENCQPSVFEYLEAKGFEPSTNVAKWATYLSCLGIEIDDSIKQHLDNNYSDEVANIILNRKVTMPSNNQVSGKWHTNLLEANHALSEMPWVLYLNWWSDKTDWSSFKNITKVTPSKKSFNKIESQLVEKLLNEDTIVVIDSVVGMDSQRNFIEQKAFKVVYISDIGSPF